MAGSFAPSLQEDPGIHSRRRSHPPVRCRDLGSLSEAVRLLERFYQRCLRSIFGIKWQDHASNEELLKRASLPSIRVHPASGAAALGWPRHKDGRRTHAQSSLLQRALRRKVQSWCSKEALQRPAEETACTGGNQPSVMAAGGLGRDSWRSSVRKASCEFEAERQKAAKEKRRRQKERAASLPSSSQTFVCPKCARECASRIGLSSHQRACKN